MKGLAKKAVAYCESKGYEFERQNSKGTLYYRNSNGHEVGIQPGMDDRGYKIVAQQIDRAAGIGPDLSQKRDPAAIKARQERERVLLKAEQERHQARLDDLAREHAAVLLGGLGAGISLRDAKAIERFIEAEHKAHRELVRQMTSRAAGAA